MRRQEDTPRLTLVRWLWLAALLACAALAAYLPLAHAGFIWDDDAFLTANPLIRASDGLRRFWFTAQASDYWPVTSTTLWIEWRLWGMHAAGYHATNLALHIVECLLIWSILRRIGVKGAYLAALLFAVHPLNVESVAWIAQRKNLVAMFFTLASTGLFIRSVFDARTGRTGAGDDDGPPLQTLPWASRPPNSLLHGLSLASFALAMLSKGSAAMLPVALALILWWRGTPARRGWRWLAPFFVISAVFVAVDIGFQRHAGAASDPGMGLTQRFLGAGAVVWFYLSKSLLPLKLLFFYPRWDIQAADLRWWVPLAAAAFVTWILWRNRSGWGRSFFFSWSYFCAMLVPVMGLTPVYFMRYSPVADHYVHLALIGVVALAGAGWVRWEQASGGPAPKAAAAAVVVLLASLAHRQCDLYRDSETLYRSTLAGNPRSWLAHNNLGALLLDRGLTDKALGHFKEALTLNPHYAEAHIGLAHAYLDLGRPADAAREARAALQEPSDFDREAHLDLGHALFQMGRIDSSIAEYQAALRIDPGYAEARYSLGNALLSLGRIPEAIAEYRSALQSAPDDASIHGNLGAALLLSGQAPEAAAEYRQALRLRPGDSAATEGLRRAIAASHSR